jgi:hypothetical protein
LEEKLEAIKKAVSRYGLVMTAHADEEAKEDDISLRDIREAITKGEVIEDYPTHRRGPCCLIYAKVSGGRNLHLVITTEKIPARVITVYEPRLPYWVTPRERRSKS